jgi:dihydrofolate reductase
MKPRISLIVAMASNRVIGANNALPWRLPSDLKRFKALTMGHHIVMGRKTFESIGRVLPGRTSVVVTRNPAWRADGVVVAGSLADAIATSPGDSEIFVIGGEQIFREALAIADCIQLTEIDQAFAGDVHFPALDDKDWRKVDAEEFSEAGLSGRFVTYERRRAS